MNDHAESSPALDSRLVLAAGGLMLLIIVLLAGLWLGTLKKANQAERDVGALQAERAKGQAILGRLFQGQLPAPAPRLDLDGLPTRPGTLDGRAVQVLALPARMGVAVGFSPGQVIVVEPESPTQPAAPPAGAPPASVPSGPAAP